MLFPPKMAIMPRKKFRGNFAIPATVTIMENNSSWSVLTGIPLIIHYPDIPWRGNIKLLAVMIVIKKSLSMMKSYGVKNPPGWD
jgi:hypothetical protein